MSTDEHITTREFTAFQRAVTDALAEGFRGVHERLDRVNGRLDKHDDAIGAVTQRVAANGVKIDNLNREVFPSGRTRKHEGENEPITLKDLKRALWVGGAVLGVIGALIQYGPVWLRAITP